MFFFSQNREIKFAKVVFFRVIFAENLFRSLRMNLDFELEKLVS